MNLSWWTTPKMGWAIIGLTVWGFYSTWSPPYGSAAAAAGAAVGILLAAVFVAGAAKWIVQRARDDTGADSGEPAA